MSNNPYPPSLTINGEKVADKAGPKMPKCPHCGVKPCRFSFAADEIGPMRVVEFFCLECKGILSISIIDIAQPKPRMVI